MDGNSGKYGGGINDISRTTIQEKQKYYRHDRETDSQIDKQSVSQSDRQINSKSVRQIDKQSVSQIDR